MFTFSSPWTGLQQFRFLSWRWCCGTPAPLSHYTESPLATRPADLMAVLHSCGDKEWQGTLSDHFTSSRERSFVTHGWPKWQAVYLYKHFMFSVVRCVQDVQLLCIDSEPWHSANSRVFDGLPLEGLQEDININLDSCDIRTWEKRDFLKRW